MTDSIPARELALLTLVAVAVRVALFVASGVSGPVGPDMGFWSYAALQLAEGAGPISYPPVLPLLAAGVRRLTGAGLEDVLWWSVLASGLLLPAMAAYAVGRLGGLGPGRLAGVLMLMLPATTLASMTVEPTAPFFLLLLGMLAAAVGVAAAGSVRSAIWLGLLGGLAIGTKEGGVVDLLLLAVPAVAASSGRRVRLAVAILALAAAVAAVLALLAPAGLAGKASVPLTDMTIWLQDGIVPAALLHDGDAVGALDQKQAQAFLVAGPAVRALMVLQVQAWRMLVLLGPWAVAAPIVAVLLIVAWRRGQLAGWQVALVLPHVMLLAGGLAVVLQGRHAEWLALGTLWGLALVLPLQPLGVRELVLVLAFAHAPVRALPELVRLEGLDRTARVEREVAAWVVDELPEGAVLASPLFSFGAATGQLVHDVMESRGPSTQLVLVLVRDGDSPYESVRSVPDALQPLVLYRTLDSPVGRFNLYLAGKEDVEVQVEHRIIDEERGLMEARPPGDTPSPHRARPGRTRRRGVDDGAR